MAEQFLSRLSPLCQRKMVQTASQRKLAFADSQLTLKY